MKRKNDRLNRLWDLRDPAETHMKDVNWTDSDAVIQMTEKTLLDKFHLTVKLPKDRLCPPLPNRLGYLAWLRRLVALDDKVPFSIKGLDIGTGASCIYPFLGSSLYNWNFIGSDIDAVGLSHARENLTRNPLLEAKIELRLVNDCSAFQQFLNTQYVLPSSLALTGGQPAKNSTGSSPQLPSLIRQQHTVTSPEDATALMRGPIRLALLEMTDHAVNGSTYAAVIESERLFYSGLDSAADDGLNPVSEVDTGEPLLYFTMCNPPFYDLAEEVCSN